jgi:hypothetical protein
MTNLLDSFFLDRNYRWSTYAVSCVASIFHASVNLLAFHRDKTEVGLETVILFCLFLALGIRLHSILRKVPTETPISTVQPGQFLNVSILATIAIAFGFIITSKSDMLPKLQAKVIDARIERVNQTVAHAYAILSPEQADTELRKRFQKLQSIADTSYRYQIPVDLDTLNKAEATIHASLKQPTLSPQTKQVGLIASAKLVDLAALRKTEANTEGPPSYVFNSAVEISDKNIRIKGDHSTITFGGGDFFIRHSTVVFDGINFRAEQPFREALYLGDSSSIVIVRDSTIENLDQTLDRVTWVNVQFQHSMIRIRGGPITLVNVSFKDCDLRWLFLGPVAVDLREKIIKADGQPITFAFEGYPEHTQKPE